jgi:tetratricopeptide (TPR) repeat protein
VSITGIKGRFFLFERKKVVYFKHNKFAFLRFKSAFRQGVKISFFPSSISFLIIVAFWVQSCSTTHQAPIHKQVYHDITSRYNAYHNAIEKWKATIKNIESNHKDDYREVIPVFPYTNAKETSAFASDCDDIVKRSTAAIQYHPYSNWSDDHFLLIGKAYYLKGDYEKAAQTFRYISTKYKDGVDYIAVQKERGKKYSDAVKKKKPKKDPNRPKYKVIKNKDGTKVLQAQDNRPKRRLEIHDPARSEAIVWLVKALTAAKQFSDAEAVVAYARSDNKFYQDYDLELLLAEADLYVKQANYQQAIDPLEKALQRLKKKPRARTRPTFVLAQCYEAVGNFSASSKTYRDVLKARPNYDMEFYAKIKRANLGRRSGGGSAEVKSLLLKMSKDGKNKEYLDQIYYELGEISLAESDKISARKYFRKSVEANKNNQEQRAQTFLRLAEIDFADELYASAKYNYDSCLLAMSKDDKRYASVEFKNKMLARLVENLNIIHIEDSLQKIAAMSEDERKRFAQKIMAQRQGEEQKKQDLGSPAPANMPANLPDNSPAGSQQNTSAWYFYNPTLRAQGYNDFIKRWGNRKYEENWRRSDKNSTAAADETSSAQSEVKDASAGTASSQINQESKPLSEEDKILKGVPLTQAELAQSNERLALAYYNLAILYKDELQNFRKSLRTFEELNHRLKKHKFLLETYYYCYLLCKDYLNQPAKAEEYKKKILAEFSDSKIAALLRNENFLAQEAERQKEIEAYYASTYNDFANGALALASEKILLSDVKFKPNPLRPKFDLLNVLILAKLNRLEDYVQALNKLIANTPDDEVRKTAQELLEMLNHSGLPMIDWSKTPQPQDTAASAQQTSPPVSNVHHAAPPVNFPNTFIDTAKNLSSSPVHPAPATGSAHSGKDSIQKKESTPAVSAPSTTKPKIDTVISNFVYQPESPHLILVYFRDASVQQPQIASAVNAINQFNSESFAQLKLTAKSVLIDEKTKLITVRQFKNQAAAGEYLKSISEKPGWMKDIDSSKYFIASISFENFSKLLTEKNGNVYEQFYQWKYQP